MKRLSSRHHPLVTTFRTLARVRARDDDRLLLDGLHLVADARRDGVAIATAAFTSRALGTAEGARLASDLAAAGTEVVEASDQVMEALSPVAAPSGVVALARRACPSLADVLAGQPQAVVIALDIQDPGNVGAMVRAAEAGGATGVVFAGASADPFGWKALRGSMGSALRLPVTAGVAPADAARAASDAGLRLIATLPHGGRRPDEVDMTGPVAFLLGGEGPGLPAGMIEGADERVSIPMRAPIESLNVAVATALLVYECARQRGAARA